MSQIRIGRDRAALDATTAPPFTVGEVITRLNALSEMDDDARKALTKTCAKSRHVATTDEDVTACWRCGALFKVKA